MRKTRVGLVLGAGGVVGAAYHAGALTALEHDLGWDARTADVIVGTSAGSLVGALLRSKIPASDLAAWTVGAPLSPDGVALAEVPRPEFDPVSLRMFMRMPRVPHRDAIWSTLLNPFRFDPMRALMTNMAEGSRSLAEHVEFLGSGWPGETLFVCACRRRTGRRVTFGRTRVPRDGLQAAVAASCAVPGYFAPVTVDGDQYIDGGVASPTNADTFKDCHLDLVIALSPMSTSARLPRYSLERAVRDRARAALRVELEQLTRRGVRTVVLEPGEEVLAQTTADFMGAEHTNDIVAAAFLETGMQLREPSRAAVFAPLRGRDRDAAA
jgi:NTE family protein